LCWPILCRNSSVRKIPKKLTNIHLLRRVSYRARPPERAMQFNACFCSTVNRVIPHAKRVQNRNEKVEEAPHGEWLQLLMYTWRERYEEKEKVSKKREGGSLSWKTRDLFFFKLHSTPQGFARVWGSIRRGVINQKQTKLVPPFNFDPRAKTETFTKRLKTRDTTLNTKSSAKKPK